MSAETSTENIEEQNKIRVLIVDDVSETRENFRKILTFEPDIEVAGLATNGREAVEMALDLRPDVVLMDINMPVMDGITASERITQQVYNCHVVMVSIHDSTDYLRRSMQAGAKGFLNKGQISIDNLLKSIHQVHQIPQRMPPVVPQITEPEPKGKIVAVYSTKGGVGGTTLATNLAIVFRQEEGKRVAIVDTRLQFGDMALLLNLQSRPNLADLAAISDAPDDELIEAALIPHASGIKAVLAPSHPELADTITPALIEHILNRLRAMFDIVLVDVGPLIDTLAIKILDLSDRIVAVTVPQISSVKNASLFFDITEALEYDPAQVLQVLNKSHKRAKIRDRQVEINTNFPISSKLPLDESAAVTAEMKGLPFTLSSRKSQLTKAVLNLSRQITQSLE